MCVPPGTHIFYKGGIAVNKRKDSYLLGGLIAGLVSALCLQGMKLVGKKMEKDEKKKP